MSDANKNPPPPPPAADPNAGLVKVEKLGETPLYVHPTCVKSHTDAGWTVSK